MSGPDSLTPPAGPTVSEPAAYDEMVSGKKSIRPHWREITATLWGMPAEIVREKQARAAAHLAAADQFLPESGDANQPIWSMDLLPLILPEAEWRTLSEGVVQRAHQPYLAFTAVHAVGVDFILIAQRWQAFAPLHQQACPLFPTGGILKGVQGGHGIDGQTHRSNSSA